MISHIAQRIMPALCAAAMLLSGCLWPTPPLPTQTPALTATASATPSPVPSPTATMTPTATLTPVPSPTPGPVCTIEWAWRNSALVITAVDPTRADALVPGDLVLTINGRTAEEVIIEMEIQFGNIGDPDERRLAALNAILFTNPGLILRVRHNQEPPYYFNLIPDCH